MLLPTVNKYEEPMAEQEHLPSLTWKIENGRMNGWVDGIGAVKQAIWKRLNTEAEVYGIYPPEYGLKTVDLIGAETDYAIGKLQSRIGETLLRDDRINRVDRFESRIDEKRVVTIGFDADTIFGSCSMETEVQI